MKSFFEREVIAHPIVISAMGAVVVIALASGWYYLSATKPPQTTTMAPLATSTPIAANGIVTPSENPDLAFVSGGRVAAVPVHVGQVVQSGQLLASLDTSALRASQEQAAANLAAAQARLAGLTAGPRAVDVSTKQTAVSQAQQSLANLEQSVYSDINTAYSDTLGALHTNSDTLFVNPDSTNPNLSFETSNTAAQVESVNQRLVVNTNLGSWKTENANLGAAPTPSQLDQGLSTSIAHLTAVRAYINALTEALGSAIPTAIFTQTQITAANTSIAALRASVTASLTKLQNDQQQIASGKLAITSAQDTLNQALAGATDEDKRAGQAAVDAAQANLDAASAALRNALVTAPFSGSVAAVHVKVGDIVGANTTAVSLIPQSALQVESYLSEKDIGRVAVGDPATVTLDATGARTFPATIVSIDRSPTQQNGVPAYKIVLQFVENDANIAPGMTANLTITPNH